MTPVLRAAARNALAVARRTYLRCLAWSSAMGEPHQALLDDVCLLADGAGVILKLEDEAE